MKKRLFALLLAMLMVCALLPVAAMAEAEEPAAETVEETVEEAAEETAEEVAEPEGEAVEPEGEIAVEPEETTEETEEEPAEETAVELDLDLDLEEASEEGEEALQIVGDPPPQPEETFSKVTSLSSGRKYVIGLESGGKLYALKNDSGSVVVVELEKAEKADSSAIWESGSGDKGVSLKNGSDYLYTGSKMTDKAAKKNWSLAGGVMTYQSKDTTYYIAMTTSAASAVKDISAASTLVVYDAGEASGGDEEDDSAVIYKETKELNKPYIAVVDTANGKALSFDRGKTESVSVKLDGKKTPREIEAVKGVCLSVASAGGGYLISIADPPDRPAALYVESGELKKIETNGLDDTSPYAKWALDSNGRLCYDKTYYLDAAGNVSKTPYADVYVFGGDKDVGPGDPPGSKTDKYAPVIDSETFAKGAAFRVGDPAGAMSFSLTASPSEDAAKSGVTPADLTYQWYKSTDGVNFEYLEGETGAALSIKPDTSEVGAYMVQCKVTNVVKGEEHSTLSSLGAYFVVNGVKEDSIMMFSDIHEEWDNIYGAFNTLLMKNGGYLPSLLMATGDFEIDHTDKAEDTVKYYNEILSRNLRIKTIGIAGNHDSGAGMNQVIKELAETDPEINKDFNGHNKLYESENLIVYGINYSDQKNGYGALIEGFKGELDKILKDDQQKKKAIIFIAHAGLHKLDNWGGEGDYNLDDQKAFAEMLNSFADEGLNISFFYGHNHSKGDPNQILNPGQSITSTVKFSEKTSQTVNLKFTYGTLGYLNANIGGGNNFGYLELGKDEQKTVIKLAALYEATAPTNYTDPEPAPAPGGNSAKGAPKTGDESTPVLWAVVVVVMAGTLVALPKKKHN